MLLEHFHIFSPAEPNGEYPAASGLGAIYAFPDMHSSNMKLRAWDYIQNQGSRAEVYYYHGLFVKVNQAVNFMERPREVQVFEKIDSVVERAWRNAKCANKFGI